MLDSLDIKNYRNLKELRISSLGRVNLITGKNNTGKSAILEAIAIYATQGDLGLIYQLLAERGENYNQPDNNTKNFTESNIKTLSSMFTNRFIGFDRDDAISVSTVENTLLGEEKSTDQSVSLRFIKYTDEIQRDSQGVTTTRKRTIVDDEIDNLLINFKVGLEIRAGNSSYILPLDEVRPYRLGGYSGIGNAQGQSFQFIRTRNIDRAINSKLWDNITLTEKEKYVIEALKIIEPSTERIAFIEESTRERSAVIKLEGATSVLPLRSMGDGINRILTIILALVNSNNGFLLIDEFENGLHHSVQEQLWNIIFKLAEKLSVQVFATTHSEDCIAGFENVLNSPENSLDGKLIRLDNMNGTIKQVEFDARELKIATAQNIETR